MRFHDGFDLPSKSFIERPQRPPAASTPAPTPNLPLEIEWLLESIADDLTMLEQMKDLPRRRDALVRKASRILAAIAELSVGHGIIADDWRSVVAELREFAQFALARHRSEPGLASLLDLDLVAQRAERSANVARDILQEYFFALCMAHAG